VLENLFRLPLITFSRYDHLTPVLVNIHWLPVRKRVIFKTAVLVWKCLHGEASNYLVDLCVPVALTEGRQRLHSAIWWSHELSQSAGLRCVRTFDVKQTTCTSAIDEHNITNVLAQIKDVPVPAVTVAVLWQHWPALLWLLQWAQRRV